MIGELLSDPKIIGSFSIGLILVVFNGVALKEMYQWFRHRPVQESGGWLGKIGKYAGIYFFLRTFALRLFFLVIGIISLGFFFTQIAEKF